MYGSIVDGIDFFFSVITLLPLLLTVSQKKKNRKRHEMKIR
jgi:hypothetical protein